MLVNQNHFSREDFQSLINWGLKPSPHDPILRNQEGKKLHPSFFYYLDKKVSNSYLNENEHLPIDFLISSQVLGKHFTSALTSKVVVIDCDTTEASEFIFNYLRSQNITAPYEKSLSFDLKTKKSYHFYFKTTTNLRTIQLRKLDLNGYPKNDLGSELLTSYQGKYRGIYHNSSGWNDFKPSDFKELPLLPNEMLVNAKKKYFIW